VSETPRRRGVRDLVTGLYPASERGKLAADDSPLDIAGGEGNVISSKWFVQCCIDPRFARMVDRWRCDCPTHGAPALPDDDPFPLDGLELALAEERAWDKIRRSEYVNIATRFADACLDRQQTPAIVAMREVVESDDLDTTTVTLAGPTGVGKTYALSAGFRARALHCDHRAVVYFPAPQLTRLLIRPGSDEIFDRCLTAELLAIDDLGSNYMKEDGLAFSLLEELIVEREAGYKPLWFTTNATQQTIADFCGDRIADRLLGGRWFNLPGASLRRRLRRTVASE
jgi:DNA replication protein DnaC